MLPPHLPGRTYDPTSDYRNDPQSPKFNRTAATETNGIPQDILDRYKYNPFNDPINTELLHLHNSPLAGAANVNVAPVKSSTAAGGGSSGGSVHNAGTGGGGNNNSSGNGGDGNTAGQWGSGGGSSGTSTAWGGSSSSGGGGSNGGNSSGDPTPAVHVPANPIVNFVRPEPTMTPRPGPPPGGPGTHRPIVHDLVGNGIKITPLTSSNHWLVRPATGINTARPGRGRAMRCCS